MGWFTAGEASGIFITVISIKVIAMNSTSILFITLLVVHLCQVVNLMG